MKLYSLLKNVKCRVLGNINLNISGLYHRDTEVKSNGLFFCIRGTQVDGVDFVKNAVKNGAVAVVTQQEISGLFGVTQIIVKNVREIMSLIACKFYKNPTEKLKIIGVTGTNGKTTISTLIFNSLKLLGKKSAVIGTNGIIIENQKYETEMTTPDPIVLQNFFSIMVKRKIEYVVMEVSAHALDLCKLEGVHFEQVIFTNLTEDHLDYFKTMERYFSAKQKLFTKKFSNLALINVDDDYGKLILKGINIPYFTYAIDEKNANLVIESLQKINKGQNFKVKFTKIQGNDIEEKNDVFPLKEKDENNSKKMTKFQDFQIKLLGSFNLSNSLAVILSLLNLGYSFNEISQVLSKLEPVDGRFNTYFLGEKLIVIDYAHSPDGLSNILKSCRELAGGKKLISVFGCGGNREFQKRKIMGEISTTLADFTIITTDNPRFEKRKDIAREIESGVKNKKYEIVLDRSCAIKRAVELASDGDVVCIAGKGSEDYIDENGVKIPYSDVAEVEKLILRQNQQKKRDKNVKIKF